MFANSVLGLRALLIIKNHIYKLIKSLQFQGHYPRPDPSVWTDEELGIPPEEE